MYMAIGLIITTVLTLFGLCKVVWPEWLIDREGDATGAPTPAELWQSRLQGLVVLAFGVVGLYAILTWEGTPAEFIGV